MNKTAHRFMLAAAALIVALVTASVALAEDFHVGRAMAVTLQGLEVDPIRTFIDTGDLPTPGGSLHAAAESLEVCLTLLKSRDLSSTTHSETGATISQSLQRDVVAFDLFPVKVTASEVMAEAHASCTELGGTTLVTDLTFAGEHVVVNGEPNQTLAIPGLATLVINEQIVDAREGTITVHALHITLAVGGELILSTARAGLACLTATEPTTWQGFKDLYR
jgi:hypothetical protein